jgi:uncharacterized protein with beta-barrel porin domain
MRNDGVGGGLSSILGAGAAHLVRGVAERMHALLAGVMLIWAVPAVAAPVADATWSTTPGSGDFNTATNWTSGFVPTGTAFFGTSTITSLSLSANTTLGGFTFNPGAPAYSFSNSQVLDFTSAGIIVNGGSATITNSNTINFLNASTAGGATITNNSSGVTQFGQVGGTDTASAGTANITNNSGGGTYFLAHTTAGSATITNNSGFILFGLSGGTDTASAGNATITNNGSIQFFANTTAASAAIANNNSSTAFNDTSTAGSAAIANNIGGFTFFSNASTAGSAAITNNGGTTVFNQTSTAGSATITNSNGGHTTFASTSTAFSATITNNYGGNTYFQDASTAGNATITNNSGGVTRFGQSGGIDISSAGSAVITNNGGVIVFNATTTAGSAAITNSNYSSTQFNDTSTAGSAAITNNGGGNIYFYATSTAGNATIANNSGGLTQFLNASTAGNAAITNDNGSILFNGTSTAGSATITNNSGIVAFFGQSDGGAAHLINGAGGTIDFSGSSGPSGDDRFGVGSLAGAGTFIVGQQQLVTVSGSLAFTSGALYMVQVSGANAGQIAVGGAAALAGNVEVDVLSRLTQKTTYTIFSSANPLSGTFNSVSVDNNSFARDPVLTYVGDNVLLTLLPGLLSPALPANAPANQVKVAGAIDNALLAGNNPTNAFNAIFNASGNALLNSLTQASGETATGSQQTTFNAMTQFLGILLDPFIDGRGAPAAPPSGAAHYAEEDSLAYASRRKRTAAERDAYAMFTKAPLATTYDPHWSVWAAGFGGSQSTDGNAAQGSNNTTSRIFGMAAGADYIFSPRTIAGFALAGGGTNFSVANGGTGRSDLFQAGAFVRHTVGAAYISGALAYGWQDITTNRTVTIAGVDQLQARFNANAFSGRVEGGYRFVTPWIGGIGITPYAAGQFTTFDIPAYAEQVLSGANTFALAYGSTSVTDTRSELGIRTDKSFAMPNGILTLRGRAAWAHDYNPDRAIGATFQSLPGASFVVNGAAQASDSALTTASAEMKWMNGWSAAATFEGEFSDVSRSYAGKGVVRYAW